MNILDKIIIDKREEVASKKKLIPLSYLVKSPLLEREALSLSQSILDGSGIIAEFKRRSPSKQVINHRDGIIEVVHGYENAGASGISVFSLHGMKPYHLESIKESADKYGLYVD